MLEICKKFNATMGASIDEKVKDLKMEPVVEKTENSNAKFTNESEESSLSALAQNVQSSSAKCENEIKPKSTQAVSSAKNQNSTKIQLSFSVDRLLGSESEVNSKKNFSQKCVTEQCCEQQQNISYCTHPGCLLPNPNNYFDNKRLSVKSVLTEPENASRDCLASPIQVPSAAFLDFTNKCIVRPMPIRALNGNSCDNDVPCMPSLSSTLATTSLLQRLYQQQQQQQHQQKQALSQAQHNAALTYSTTMSTANSPTLPPLVVTPMTCNLKSLQHNSHAVAMATATAAAIHQHQQQQQQQQNIQQQQQHFRLNVSPSHPFAKLKLPTANHIDIPTPSNGHYYQAAHPLLQQLHHHHQHQQLPQTHQQHPQHQQHQAMLSHLQLSAANNINGNGLGNHNNNNSSSNNCNTNGGSGNTNSNSSTNNAHNNNGKRKRSWSRAVFSNLQRKGLEIQFQQQKYITKPDRRKLAARLNLTDAQVKVWFQNRRMKWRHTRENLKSGQEKQPTISDGGHNGSAAQKLPPLDDMQRDLDYSTDGSESSMAISDNEEEGDIDVVE